MADNYQTGNQQNDSAAEDAGLMSYFARLPQIIANAVNPTGADLRYTPRYTLPDVGLRIGQQGQPAINATFPDIPGAIARAVNPTGADLRYRGQYTLPDIGARIGRVGTPGITTEETLATTPFVAVRPQAVAPNTVPYRSFPNRPQAIAPNPYVTSNFPARPEQVAPSPYVTSSFPARPDYVSRNNVSQASVEGMTPSTGRAKMTKPVIPRDAEESKGRAHMGTKGEQRAEQSDEFLNNDPEDMRPGSLGEARKLFPDRPLQQAIYYTDPKSGNMRRLGVGADTSTLNSDYVSRIWEPADMSFGEKAIRGAFEKQGPNPLTWSPGKAEGGAIDSANRVAGEKGTPCHVGLITMAVGGRTDHIPMNVLEGSYVLPADIVSGLGEGNTLAGSKIIENMFRSGPFGMAYPQAKFAAPKYPETPSYPGFSLADTLKVNPMPTGEKEKAGGGSVSSRNLKPIPIVAAGGEYVIDPDTVRRIGGGSIDKGHEFLDHFVKGARKELVKTLQKLPGPKRD